MGPQPVSLQRAELVQRYIRVDVPEPLGDGQPQGEFGAGLQFVLRSRW
ncbi:MAG: hypothetical protein RMJ88_11010 [Thermogemmata sp.]|nr:hypothetical protein [Thermogemmata sp.]